MNRLTYLPIDRHESVPSLGSSARAGLHGIHEAFDPISLDDLNSRAAMLERLDNKYVVSAETLHEAAAQLAGEFDILEIDGVRAFNYDTWYFDDESRQSYFDHHGGRRKRCKVRVRRYREAQLCYVEVKLKDRRSVTVKKRLRYDVAKYGVLDERANEHIQASYRGLYGSEFDLDLEPMLEVSYQRMTLVAKAGGERLTIDTKLTFRSQRNALSVSPDRFIVETKSSNGNGLADKVLRNLHKHPVDSCSKYCVGMVALELVRKRNKFLPALRQLDIVPPGPTPRLRRMPPKLRLSTEHRAAQAPVDH